MPTTSPLRIHADMPAVVFGVPAGTDVLTVPCPALPLANPTSAIAQALLTPRGTLPLAQVVAAASPEKAPADKTAVIVVSDITRPDVPYTGPASILHPVLHTLEAQGLVPEHMTILVATGTHRANNPEELEAMLGPELVANYRIVNHDAFDKSTQTRVGRLEDGTEVWLNKELVKAGKRILTGFIEPHFFAGFSGGPKGIMPGVAALETVQSNHGASNIADPRATFGKGSNPTLISNACADYSPRSVRCHTSRSFRAGASGRSLSMRNMI